MNKKNEDLLHSIQRMEEKIKNLTRENVEMVSRWLLRTSPGILSLLGFSAPPLALRVPWDAPITSAGKLMSRLSAPVPPVCFSGLYRAAARRDPAR